MTAIETRAYVWSRKCMRFTRWPRKRGWSFKAWENIRYRPCRSFVINSVLLRFAGWSLNWGSTGARDVIATARQNYRGRRRGW